jgi:hypothetical protein
MHDDDDSWGVSDTQETTTEDQATPGPSEVFCVECGSVIKQQAEICPECGVRQNLRDEGGGGSQGQTGYGLSQQRQRELEKIADNDQTAVLLLGFFASPVAYIMLGKPLLALVNFFTLNYFFLGALLVPLHCYKLMEDAETELNRAGVGGYR